MKVLDARKITNQLEVSNIVELNAELKEGFYPLNTYKSDENWKSIKDLSVPKIVSGFEVTSIKGETLYSEDKQADLQKTGGIKKREYPKFIPKSRIILNQK